MLLQHPFLSLTPTVDGDVLQVLARSHDEFTVPRLAALVPHRSTSGIRLALERLNDHGIVWSRHAGRTLIYGFNESHVLAEPVRAIADAKRTVLLRLQEVAEQWEHPPLFGALFGSGARGDMSTDSDLDVFFVCPDVRDHDWGITLGEFMDFAADLTGNETQVVELHGDEVLATQHRPLIESVLREGIPFTGDPSWLRRAIAAGVAA